MKKIFTYCRVLVILLFLPLYGSAQQAIKINRPDSTVVTYNNTDSRAFALTGLTTFYANPSWPGTPSDTGCIYWGVNDTLFSVINGNNTQPPNNGCAGMSNLILTTNPSYTNLASGQACFVGSTSLTFIWGPGYSYSNYGFVAYQYIWVRKKSNNAPIPFVQVDGKILAKVPDADFYVSTSLFLSWSNGTFTFTTDGSTIYNGNYYAISLFDKLHTNPSYSICTSWSGGDFYRIPFTAGFNLANPICYGAATGSINTSTIGGVSPFQFNWNTNNPTSEDQVGIKAGTYSVNITDAAGCMITRQVSLSQPDSIRANLQLTPVNCAGQANGAALANPTGGTGTLGITWYNGSTVSSISSLEPGKYGIKVKDEKGCTTNDTAVITQPDSLKYNLALVDPTCFGFSDGSVTVTPHGGTAPYTYLWSTGDSSSIADSLPAGNYSITLKDDHLCMVNILTELIAPSGLQVTPGITDVSCYGLKDGTIHVDISGGTSPYDVSWNAGSATGTDLASLAPGDYLAKITDAHLCTLEKSFTVTEPDSLTLILNQNNVQCAGENNGSINALVNGGTMPYTYNWSNDSTLGEVSGLVPGLYSLTVKDKHNCTVIGSAIITEPAVLDLLLTPTSPVCSYGKDGEINAEASGGTVPYQYLWSTGDTISLLANIGKGTYTLTLKDKNGCEKQASLDLPSLSNLNVLAELGPISCFGKLDGSLSLTVSGGKEPYDILWEGGSTSNLRTELGPGIYPFRVYDDYLCVVRDTLPLTEPATLLAVATPVSPTCYQGNNGQVNLSVSGGTTPYSFLWSNQETTPAISGISAGNYKVEVTDAHGCTTLDSAVVNDPPEDAAAYTYVSDNGQVTFTNTSTPGSNAWDFGDSQGSQETNPVHVYKSNGTYTVCLNVTTDCSTKQYCQDIVIDGITIIPKTGTTVSVYPNPASETAFISWEGRSKPQQILVFDALGREVKTLQPSGTDMQQLNISDLSNGIYQIKLIFDGKSESLRLVISR